MRITRSLHVKNGSTLPLREVPSLKFEHFSHEILSQVKNQARVSALFSLPSEGGKSDLFALLAHDAEGVLSLFSTPVKKEYPSLTPLIPMMHLFEREIYESEGLLPKGHPWLKPVRSPLDEKTISSFFEIRGEKIHEVAVGPVHAGIIEPGHFRFQCHGEKVLFLETALGYQHRGIEKALVGGPDKKTIHYMETIAGDTTIGHTLAYVTLIESLSRIRISPRAHALRAIALELERIANHIGDLGALSGDVGFLPTQSFCGRLRGDVLNMTALLSGNRFGRSLLQVGGQHFDVDEELTSTLTSRLKTLLPSLEGAIHLLWETPSVMARFEEVGTISAKDCRLLGLVGPAARASGVDTDVRKDHPYGLYRFAYLPTVTCEKGDVFSRAYVRWLEIERSIAFLIEQLDNLPSGDLSQQIPPLQPNALCFSLVEGWRGEICHVAITDEKGRFKKYKIIDPSFHNWFGLAHAMREQEIFDFPLCNKSFNLSYAGHDL